MVINVANTNDPKFRMVYEMNNWPTVAAMDIEMIPCMHEGWCKTNSTALDSWSVKASMPNAMDEEIAVMCKI